MTKFKSLHLSFILHLLVWIAIGAGLRFALLSSKPPWNDEFATLVFSLGNSFRIVPLDSAIALDDLIVPLRPNPHAGLSLVFQHLMTESTHPPIYFVLTHLWLKLFPTENGLVSIWAARSLSAILGTASIPAIFGLGWLAFRSRLVGYVAAAMMAVSPYGIYQAQEARHYTLAILLVIASLSCLVVATRSIDRRTPLPIWLGLAWVVINTLGIAVHYFFALTLCGEALVLIIFLIYHTKTKVSSSSVPLWRFFAVAAGTLAGGLVWLPAWQNVPDNRVTEWIYNNDFISNWLEPVARVIAWIITMLALLPVEGTTKPIAIASCVLLVSFILLMLPTIVSGLRIQLGQSHTRQETQVLSGYVLAVLALIFCITFGLGADLTIAARYHFVYFPAIIVLLGAALAICWDASKLLASQEFSWTTRQQSLLHFLKGRGRKAVVLTLLMGFIGAITVVSNFAYQKSDRPDLLAPIIQERSQQKTTLIATAHKTHEQTGEMMGLALEFKHIHRSLEQASTGSVNPPMFLLAHQEPGSHDSAATLYKVLSQLPKPLDLWIVNFPRATANLEAQNCLIDTQARPKTNGYRYKHYRCS